MEYEVSDDVQLKAMHNFRGTALTQRVKSISEERDFI